MIILYENLMIELIISSVSNSESKKYDGKEKDKRFSTEDES